MIFDRSKYSDCKNCPFEEKAKVWGQGNSKAKLMFLGEAPGASEESDGKPFTGGVGRVLNKALGQVGIFREHIWMTNVIACRPPKNNINGLEAKDATECCKAGLASEIEAFRKRGGTVIMPLGNAACSAFGIEYGITKVRGSVYQREGGLVIVPTYHPAHIMFGNFKETPTWLNDIDKALSIVLNGYEKPRELFKLRPTVEEVNNFVEKAVKKGSLISVDIETTGFNLDYSEIIVIGLATDGEHALSVPFFKMGGTPYWKAKDEIKVRKLLNKLFSKCPTMYQNALFDVRHLRHHNFTVEKVAEDVMLAAHAYHPELPKNLGYITSVYGKTPYWKGPVVNNIKNMTHIDDETVWVYNLRDAVTPHQILPGIVKDLKDTKTYSIYKNTSIPLIMPLISMTENGMKIDQKKLKNWKASLKRKLSLCDKKMREISGVSPQFNFDSDQDLKYLFFAVLPNKLVKAREELKKYKTNPKLKKNTKKYRNLVDTVSSFKGFKPLLNESFVSIKTDSGSASTSEDALVSVKKHAIREIQAIERRSKNRKMTLEKKDRLNKSIEIIDLFLEHKRVSKLVSTYTSFPIRKDGRIHPSFRIAATATGRLSSNSPNAQNIPDEARKVIVADEGNVIIKADYENLELRVLAYVSDDDVSITAFERGEDAHDNNTRDLFGIDKDDPMFKIARAAAKIYIFGRNYGGGIRGIYSRVVKKVPGLELTEAQFAAADNAYRNAHPKYTEWHNRIVKEVVRNKILYSCFGRVRIFLGTSDEVIREGLNFLIQSPAADIVNKAIISLYNDPQLEKLDAKLIASVHDEIDIECPAENKRAVGKLLRKHMEQEHIINCKKRRFPIEITYGKAWNKESQKELKL